MAYYGNIGFEFALEDLRIQFIIRALVKIHFRATIKEFILSEKYLENRNINRPNSPLGLPSRLN